MKKASKLGIFGVLAYGLYSIFKDDENGLKAAKILGNGMKIETSSINPKASLTAIEKIISKKVIYYKYKEAYSTKSIYLSFEDSKENELFIRISDHTKAERINSNIDYNIDVIEEILQNNYKEIHVDIFDSESKRIALDYLKNHFKNLKTILSKEVFVYVKPKTPKLKINDNVKEFLSKYKIDTTKSEKQIRLQIIKLLNKKKPIGILEKGIYQGSGRRTRKVGIEEIIGKIVWIATTGNEATVQKKSNKKEVTSRKFKIRNKRLNALLEISRTSFRFWDYEIKKI